MGRLKYTENASLPAQCQSCEEKDCWECDYAGTRWIFSERDRLIYARKLKEQAIARFQRQIAEIDRQLEKLKTNQDRHHS